MDCSVIIASCNRVASLAKTLQAFGEVAIPPGWLAELLVVDNASTDQTAVVVKQAGLKNFSVRYLYEARPGKSNALNTGLSAARGEVLLFTDDDVVPAVDWLEKIATPLFRREFDGVVGRIQLAKHLVRPWLKPMHKLWLLALDEPYGNTPQLIGANMGLHKSVFEQIPGFDPELGPGATGFGEETLLSWQMSAAGFRLGSIPEAIVVHHPDSSRLLRSEWLSGALKRGRSPAYLLHHWQHGQLKTPHLRLCHLGIKLFLRRLIQRPPSVDEEGCPPWEMSYVAELEMHRRFLQERKRPRNYSKHGLRKQTGQT